MNFMSHRPLLPFFVMIPVFFCAPPAGAEKVKITYTVKKGDTLAKIAGKFNVEVASIEEWNKKLFKKEGEAQAEEAAPEAKKITEASFPKVIPSGTKLKIPKKDENGKGIIHEVQAGETFIMIARQYGVTKSKLLKWNKKLFGYADEPSKKKKKPKCKAKKGKKSKTKCVEEGGSDTVQPDMELVIFAERPDLGPRVGIYTAAAGDTPAAIAKKFKINLDDLLDFNFMMKGDILRKNEVVEVPFPLPEALALSVGSPSSGKLVNGEKMPAGPGYVIKSPDYSYGTNETITYLINCIGEVHREFPGTHDMIIGHLSKKNGGRFHPHKSHASGRDADVGFLFDGVKPSSFMKVSADNFDVAKTMHFIMCLVDTQQVEYIFINYYIQKIMYAYMKNKNTAESVLTGLIQFPRPIEKHLGLIRHDKGHDDHMHIRFVCPETSKNCYD